MKHFFVYKLFFALLLLGCVCQDAAAQKQLKVSPNGRYFTDEKGKPFFWLGDTGWLLFVKSSREDAIHYLDTRKAQGFNVIQVMVLHDLNNTKNAFGDSALMNLDASRPKVTPGSNPSNADEYDYWDHVDFIVKEAAKRNMYMGMVPVWGSNVKGGKVSVQQGEAYSRFLANRYKDQWNIIWLNGGDVKGTEGLEVWKAIGNILKTVDGKHLVTYHPRGRTSSSDWFHNEPWLDFNMFQSGHKAYAQDTVSSEKNHYGEDNWKFIDVDYKLTPTKPTLDGEPSYENIPHGLHDSLLPRWKDADLRRYGYWSVFAGGAGFTYGENATMQFNKMGDWTANYGVTQNWKDALLSPGARQIVHLKNLMLSKSYFDRMPAQDLVVDNGERYNRVAATKGSNYAMFYVYNGRNFTVKETIFPGRSLKASWFNPRTGTTQSIGRVVIKTAQTFDPPGEQADGNDWVLILENSFKK